MNAIHEISIEEYFALLAAQKANKYQAIRTEVDGIVFASAAEARRYGELKLMLDAGEIAHLALQPRFPLAVNGVDCGTYVGDFEYFEVSSGRSILEDVKSKATMTATYRLKKKIVRALYGIDITEVMGR